MADSLYCSLCDEFLVDPKDLPCRHSFCRTCLQKHCVNKANDDSFPCPECKAPVKAKDPNAPLMEWVDAILTNQMTVTRLEKILNIEKDKKQKKCMFCLKKYKTERATKYCKSCEEYFCDECGNQHWLLRASKEHRVWLIDDLMALKKETPIRARLVAMFNNKQKHAQFKSKAQDASLARVETDTEECEIVGTTFLDNGAIVITDKANEKIKVFNKQYQLVASYVVKSCHDVVALNQYFIVVTCPEKRCIKIFSIFENDIEEESAILTDSNCYGVCRVDDNFAVGLSGIPAFLLLYSGRKNLETIKIESGKILLLKPHYIAYSNANQNFFISDSTNHCLKCVSKKGALVWERKISECRGLAMFDEHLLLARSDRKTVDIVNFSGKIIKSVVEPEDGLSKIQAISVDLWKTESNSKRMAVADDSNLIRVFVIEDPMKDDDLQVYFSKSKPSMSGNQDDSKTEDTKDKVRVCSII